MKIGVIVQARMGSSRLPGKIMKNLSGKTVLEHVVDRLKYSEYVNSIIIATTMDKGDDIVAESMTNYGVSVFRGSEDNVLERYYLAAKENELDIVVRVTSDCPLIDPIVMDAIIKKYVEGNFDLVTNAGADLTKRTFPRGLDVEVFSFKLLEKTFKNAKLDHQKEHVTPYIYENCENIFYYTNEHDFSKYRWTLDTAEDFELISIIYEKLYSDKIMFFMNEILMLFENEPQLTLINSHIEQKEIK